MHFSKRVPSLEIPGTRGGGKVLQGRQAWWVLATARHGSADPPPMFYGPLALPWVIAPQWCDSRHREVWTDDAWGREATLGAQ